MSKKSKNADSSSYSNIDLGKDRKARIKRFRSQVDPEGTRFTKLDDAVNALIDRGIEAELINA